MRRADAATRACDLEPGSEERGKSPAPGLTLAGGVVVDATSPGDDGPGGSGSSMTRKVKSHLNGN
jgi:hypothetical protein